MRIGETGVIESVLVPDHIDYEATLDRLRSEPGFTELGSGDHLLPGFVDLHNHAPQWPQLGKALDVPLADWLNRHTFPLEARFADEEFAERVYESLVEAMLAHGTTTAVYFGSAHLAATQLLAKLCLEKGQRALVGRVAMDAADTCPDYYRDPEAAVAIEETQALIEQVRTMPGNEQNLVRPVATPRFLPSCTDELLAGLGDLVRTTGVHVQTHCSESDWAHEYGLARYGRTDTVSYDHFGLLTRNTVLAHCNLITPADIDLISLRQAAVAHCPLSNAYFANAVFPVRRALESGVQIGLGTDISGGPGPSILGAMADAVVMSRLLEDGVDARLPAANRGVPDSRVGFAEAFYLGTRGGGVALDLPIGELSPGMLFDAVVVDTEATDSDLVVWDGLDETEEILQKIINNANRNNIRQVWVGGVPVHGAG
jgi:guanine deaminase